MTESLDLNIDKFVFRVAVDRLYTAEGIWVKFEGGNLRLGISDFLQQRSGDVAFAEVKPEDTFLAVGEELAVIETIKVNIGLPSPVNGTILKVNPAMESRPEVINLDPYGEGWLCTVSPVDPLIGHEGLLDAQAYFEIMKTQAQDAAR